MKNKKIMLIIILLIIIGVGYLVATLFNSYNSDSNVTNIHTNNTSFSNTSVNVNKSSNATADDSLEENSTSYDSNHARYSSSKSTYESDDISDEFTASDAKNVVKNHVGGVWGKDISELKIGNPKYKNSDGGWLVPLYDKKTSKFVGAQYAYSDGMTHGGVDNYDNYKRVVSGKEPKKPKFRYNA